MLAAILEARLLCFALLAWSLADFYKAKLCGGYKYKTCKSFCSVFSLTVNVHLEWHQNAWRLVVEASWLPVQ